MRPLTDEAALTIGEVERRTGLAKDTLRVWERRYGFPQPLRTAQANRAYPADQVEKLALIRTLLDRGHRPAKLVGQPIAELRGLVEAGEAPHAAAHPVATFFEDLERGEVGRLSHWLSHTLMRHGLERFVLDIAAPAAAAVGEAWAGGRLPIYAEHLFTEQLCRALRGAIAELPQPPPQTRPRILLATLPGEPHVLGLLMAEAVLSLEGAACLSLGPETPPSQIAAAARAHASDVVALSVSAASAGRMARRDVTALLAAAPEGLEVWLGGGGAAALQIGEARLVSGLGGAPAAVGDWRRRHAVGAGASA